MQSPASLYRCALVFQREQRAQGACLALALLFLSNTSLSTLPKPTTQRAILPVLSCLFFALERRRGQGRALSESQSSDLAGWPKIGPAETSREPATLHSYWVAAKQTSPTHVAAPRPPCSPNWPAAPKRWRDRGVSADSWWKLVAGCEVRLTGSSGAVVARSRAPY